MLSRIAVILIHRVYIFTVVQANDKVVKHLILCDDCKQAAVILSK